MLWIYGQLVVTTLFVGGKRGHDARDWPDLAQGTVLTQRPQLGSGAMGRHRQPHRARPAPHRTAVEFAVVQRHVERPVSDEDNHVRVLLRLPEDNVESFSSLGRRRARPPQRPGSRRLGEVVRGRRRVELAFITPAPSKPAKAHEPACTPSA